MQSYATLKFIYDVGSGDGPFHKQVFAHKSGLIHLHERHILVSDDVQQDEHVDFFQLVFLLPFRRQVAGSVKAK